MCSQSHISLSSSLSLTPSLSLPLSLSDTHTLTHKGLCAVFHTSTPPGANTVLQSPLEGQQAGKWPHAVPRSPWPRLVTPVSQGPAEGPMPPGLPLTPHYLPGPNVNRGSSPQTMSAGKRGKEMSQGSLTTKVRPPDLQGWSHWASLCKHRVSKQKQTLC